MEGIFLLLGSNLGERRESLANARKVLSLEIGPIIKSSAIHESSAWGLKEQPDFLNQVVQIETEIDPHTLLRKIQGIEIELGRVRYEKWGPRKIDIDILYYHDLVMATEDLILPHPGIPERRFTLEPLKEIAPDFIHPLLLKTNSELLDASKDDLNVQVMLEA